MMKDIAEIIQSIKSSSPNINPTQIYNEGWMIRLLVKKSIENNILLEERIDFKRIRNWTSEALISSPFIKAPSFREGYTHVDMAVGDFSVDYENRGEIKLDSHAAVFGIFEAKMRSNLSQGTTHYPKGYNQAARNIACIAKSIRGKECDTFFSVVGPEVWLENHKIEEQTSRKTIYDQIKNRFDFYKDKSMDFVQKKEKILDAVARVRIFMVTYEEWIKKFSGEAFEFLNSFYEDAKKYNKLE